MVPPAFDPEALASTELTEAVAMGVPAVPLAGPVAVTVGDDLVIVST